MSLPAEVAAAARRRTCVLVLGPSWPTSTDSADARLRATGLAAWCAHPDGSTPWPRLSDHGPDDAALREALRGRTVVYAGFRPEQEPFPSVHARLVRAWGGPLPRAHLAVSGAPPGDATWQKWVWRGVLPFLIEPDTLLRALEEALA
jgi:hypothetical protein